MADSPGTSTPARTSGEISNPQVHGALPIPPSMMAPVLAGASVPATAATSLLTIVQMEGDGNVPSVSRPQTAGGPCNDGQEGVAGTAGENGSETEVKQTEELGNGEEALSALPAQPLQQIALTFLLVNGRRKTMYFDPDATIGRVRELVWNAWPSDWPDERPPAPNYLRILYLGKILQDDDTLSQVSHPLSATSPVEDLASLPPIIMHLSIRPIAPPTENDTLKKKSARVGRRGLSRSTSTAPGEGDADDNSISSCCGCVIC